VRRTSARGLTLPARDGFFGHVSPRSAALRFPVLTASSMTRTFSGSVCMWYWFVQKRTSCPSGRGTWAGSSRRSRSAHQRALLRVRSGAWREPGSSPCPGHRWRSSRNRASSIRMSFRGSSIPTGPRAGLLTRWIQEQGQRSPGRRASRPGRLGHTTMGRTRTKRSRPSGAARVGKHPDKDRAPSCRTRRIGALESRGRRRAIRLDENRRGQPDAGLSQALRQVADRAGELPHQIRSRNASESTQCFALSRQVELRRLADEGKTSLLPPP
jgi:hypothetical protein